MSTSADSDRPQDAGRPHRRKGSPSAATRSLLSRYHAAMRDTLGALLDELEPKAPPAGLGLVDTGPERPKVADAARLWDLAIKLGRELGSEIEPTPPPTAGSSGRPTRRRRPDYGG